ncbi:MAG: CvfD/Ygs/GSP13 family RNA-binding post-transcriptional regulator [Erysipelotrichales bacterium]
MKYKKGDVVIGNVTSIKPYGAFISLPQHKSGLLHISEVSHDYIKDINTVLKINEKVKVKIIDVNEKENQIIFSIKALSKSKRKTRTKNRTRHKEMIMETKKGFSELENLLPYWMDNYDGGKI